MMDDRIRIKPEMKHFQSTVQFKYEWPNMKVTYLGI
jgi:hypothetical protein